MFSSSSTLLKIVLLTSCYFYFPFPLLRLLLRDRRPALRRLILLSCCPLFHRWSTGPQEPTVGEITEFQKLFLAPGFLVWIGILIATALTIVFYFAPRFVDCSTYKRRNADFFCFSQDMARRACCGISSCVVWLVGYLLVSPLVLDLLLYKRPWATTRYVIVFHLLFSRELNVPFTLQFKHWFMYFLFGFVAITLRRWFFLNLVF